MKKKKYPKYINAAIVAIMLNVLSFVFSSFNIVAWEYILIISVIYFIWEAFIERLVIGEEK